MLPIDWVSQLPSETFGPGRTIIEFGTNPDRIYFLKSGTVEVVREGTRVALLRTPGSVFGEISILLKIPATASVIALDEAELHVAEDPLEFLRSHPEVNLHVSKTLAFRLDAATRYLVDVKEQLAECSDHVGMVDGVLDAIIHRDLKKKVAP